MTNKTQTMLTIALTAAVSLLLVDRIIEPAHAQSCAPSWMVTDVNTEVVGVSTDLEYLSGDVRELKRVVDDVAANLTLADVKLDTLLMMAE